MSGFLSPKFLRYRAALAKGTIDRDLACTHCGYNVRGLNWGRNCPECGAPIEIEPSEDALLAGSWSHRTRWRYGLAAGAACLFAAPALGALLLFVGFGAVGAVLAWVYMLMGAAAATTWALAAWLMTPEGLAARWPWMRHGRLVIRGSQALWPAGSMLWLAAMASGLARLADLSRVLGVVAVLGAAVLAAVLCLIAETAGRFTAARRLNAVVWLLPPTTVVLLLMPRNMACLALLVLAVWGVAMVLFGLGLLELQRHVAWTMSLAESMHTRDQRIRQTRESLDEQVAATVRPLPELPPDLPWGPENEPGDS